MNKHLACLALAFISGPFAVSLCAQEAPMPEQYEPPPPVGVDADFYAPPKNRIQIGMRMLSAPKVAISGQGSISPLLGIGNPSDENVNRFYNDGTVLTDTRVDTSGNPLNPTDHATNTWSYQSSSQVTADQKHVQMHSYNADVDPTSQSGKGPSSAGIEFTFERETGWHWGKLQINWIVGLSLNDIRYARTQETSGTITTTIDTYATLTTKDSVSPPTTDGTPTTVPPAPYSAPSTASDGTTDTTTLLEDKPDNSTQSQSPAAEGQLENQYKIHGAFFMMRFGPKLIMPLTSKFQASFSTGPALVYVGTTFTVNQRFTPAVGDPSTTTITGQKDDVLPAYFADANLEYWLTDRTGFYFGGVYQTSTNYHHTVSDAASDSRYTSTVDLTGQQGWHLGMDYKF
ncbi:MAG: hypothetical protein KGJ37_01380 [Verrucomicrobiota bacterium]|nr:hypothetical protein [Verrucomicrobiota bacterium]